MLIKVLGWGKYILYFTIVTSSKSAEYFPLDKSQTVFTDKTLLSTWWRCIWCLALSSHWTTQPICYAMIWNFWSNSRLDTLVCNYYKKCDITQSLLFKPLPCFPLLALLLFVKVCWQSLTPIHKICTSGTFRRIMKTILATYMCEHYFNHCLYYCFQHV